MLKRVRRQIAVVACSIISISGLAAGVFAQCDGNYCNVNTFGCTPMGQSIQDSCCEPTPTGSRCMTCWRQYYWCLNIMILGTAYNCSNAGAYCS